MVCHFVVSQCNFSRHLLRDNWAKTTSANKNVKVYIGAAGSADAAGTGYVDASTLANYASDAQSKYSSFGGVMMWDADTAYSMSSSTFT